MSFEEERDRSIKVGAELFLDIFACIQAHMKKWTPDVDAYMAIDHALSLFTTHQYSIIYDSCGKDKCLEAVEHDYEYLRDFFLNGRGEACDVQDV